MSTFASRITSLASVHSILYSRRRSKKTSKLRVTGLCVGNSPVTGEFLQQRASNAENKCFHLMTASYDWWIFVPKPLYVIVVIPIMITIITLCNKSRDSIFIGFIIIYNNNLYLSSSVADVWVYFDGAINISTANFRRITRRISFFSPWNKCHGKDLCAA